MDADIKENGGTTKCDGLVASGHFQSNFSVHMSLRRCRLGVTAAPWHNMSPVAVSAQEQDASRYSSSFFGASLQKMQTESAVNNVRAFCIGNYTGPTKSVQKYGISNLRQITTQAQGLGILHQVLWGQKAGLVLQQGSFLGAGTQQVRHVMVDVTNDDLERAMRKMKRRLKDDGGIRLLRERQYFRKPSELKVLARKERDKRIAKKSFRIKLKWIQNQRSRGF